jgi:hypothetical protein
MGTGGTVSCNGCNKQYNFMRGEGKNTYALTCDKCGDQKVVPIIELENVKNLTCPCKGRFVKDAIIKCPDCNSNDYQFISIVDWD